MPALETLPRGYWDLLSLCWKRDLGLARKLLPTIVGRMTNPLLRSAMAYFAENFTLPLEKLFDQYAETRGRIAYQYRGIHLEGFGGALRSVFCLAQSASRQYYRNNHRPPAFPTTPATRT
jgi:hypothetical protein